MSRLYFAGLLLLLTAVGGCAPRTAPEAPPPTDPQLNLTPVSYQKLPGWNDDDQGAALGAFVVSCARLLAAPADKPVEKSGAGGLNGQWWPACRAAILGTKQGNLARDRAAARRFFETWFTPYQAVSANGDEGLFTGYYEAGLKGSFRRHGVYQVPLYRMPPDWGGTASGGLALSPTRAPTRAEIEAGALSGRGLELMWVDSAIDAFFLHVQGSGRVDMDDGYVVRVGFAGRNGHPYRSIGRILIDQGVIAREDMSMQALRSWLAKNPAKGARVMAMNPSYIFFRASIGTGTDPKGAAGVALTPGRSLAVDRRFVPLGAPVWLDTTDPISPATPLRRLVIAQDTGSAIKGAVRGDLFWGAGAGAAARAGAMKQAGRYFILLPRR